MGGPLVKVGCHLPMYGPVGTRDNVLTFARRIEALGYDSLWASDHVVIPYRIAPHYPYSPDGRFPLTADVPFLEPLTTLALVAGVTERVQLGTSILVLPHRNPVMAAKMCATLDHLAGGRLVREIVQRVREGRGHRPARVLLVRPGTIPKTSSGKIQRSRLAEMIARDELAPSLLHASGAPG